MIKKGVEFTNNLSQKIAGRIYKSEHTSGKGVIFCHGLFSSKDAYKINRMADNIVNAGYTLLTFDFSFVGDSQGDISKLSILQEVEDLRSAVNFFKSYCNQSLHIIGSSMGGVVSLIYLSGNSAEVDSLTLIATPVKLKELLFTDLDLDNVDILPDEGMTLLDGIPVHNKFFKEIKHIDMDEALLKITIPTLIIHGALDDVVDISNVQRMEEKLNPQFHSVIIEDGDHNLTRDSDIILLEENILTWLDDHS